MDLAFLKYFLMSPKVRRGEHSHVSPYLGSNSTEETFSMKEFFSGQNVFSIVGGTQCQSQGNHNGC